MRTYQLNTKDMYKTNEVKAVSVESLTNAKGRAVANQFVVTLASGTYFQSYRTIIAHRCNMGRLTLDKNYYNYSKTTSRHRNTFTGLTTKETEKGIEDGSIELANLNGVNHRI